MCVLVHLCVWLCVFGVGAEVDGRRPEELETGCGGRVGE